MRTIKPLILLSLSAVLLLSSGCSIASDYRIPSGSTQTRGYTSIAGNVEVGRKAVIRNARTVAGNIEVEDDGRAGDLSSVAGNIRLGANVKVEGSVKTVAGDIRIERGCSIVGDVTTVAGRMEIEDSVVTGNVTLTSGSLELTGSRVTGVLRVKHAFGDSDEAKVWIGPGSEVPEVIVDKKAVVRLRIHRSAKVGKVTGAEAEYYD